MRPDPWITRLALAGSLLLHGVLIILLALEPNVPRFETVPEDSVEIDIVTLPDPQPPAPPPASAALDLPPAAQAPAPAEAPRPPPGGPVRPTHMLSDAVIGGPDGRRMKAALARLGEGDRIIQLCSIEALAQAAAFDKQLRPDFLVAYAMADTRLVGHSLTARGAAIHGGQQWFALTFRCDLTADHRKITAFEFAIGDAIPRALWAKHNLPANGGRLE